LLKTVIVLQPDNYIAVSMLSNLYYISGRHKEAEAVFRNMARIHPDNHTVYNSLSTAVASQDRLKEALEYASRAVELNPESGDALINMAVINSCLNHRDAAMKYFKKAYEVLGHKIVPAAFDPSLDNIRYHPDFINIIREAQRKKMFIEKERRENKTENEHNQNSSRPNKQ